MSGLKKSGAHFGVGIISGAIHVSYDLLLNRRTATWNLFVLDYKNTQKKDHAQEKMFKCRGL